MTTELTATTLQKAKALRAALPHHQSVDTVALLAMLTSVNKDEREKAKRVVRDLMQAGLQVIQSERLAVDLADWANRSEPD